jgi:FkbM family methyltransferase
MLGSREQRRGAHDDARLVLLLTFLLGRDSNCIDVGAHTGDLLHRMVRLAPEGRHFAWEPIPGMAAALERRFPKVDVHAAALSDKDGTATFHVAHERPAVSGLSERGDVGNVCFKPIQVTTETLDNALPDGYVPTFIKIDVEGAEGMVLRGAIETLRHHQPTVVFEHGKGGAAQFGTGPDEILDILVEGAGLRVFDLEGRGPIHARGIPGYVCARRSLEFRGAPIDNRRATRAVRRLLYRASSGRSGGPWVTPAREHREVVAVNHAEGN